MFIFWFSIEQIYDNFMIQSHNGDVHIAILRFENIVMDNFITYAKESLILRRLRQMGLGEKKKKKL